MARHPGHIPCSFLSKIRCRRPEASCGFSSSRLCTVLAAKGSTATSSGIVRHIWSKIRSARSRAGLQSGPHRRELDRMELGRGRDAEAPWQIPARGWADILRRAWKDTGKRNLSLVAGGGTYYLLLG